MHPIQLALNWVVDAGLPGVFVYIEDTDGTSQFYTAGFADLVSRQRMTPQSWYRIGSTRILSVISWLLRIRADSGDTCHSSS